MHQTSSRPVSTSQTEPHQRLLVAVARHRDQEYRKPVADHSRRAFDQVQELNKKWAGRIRLDTGCGVGESTVRLAQNHPTDFILGVDKSLHRLETHQRALFDRSASNYALIRMDLEDFWRLAHRAGMHFLAQYFFYPNPWPRKQHYLRRWPAHSVFPRALELSDEVELRTNWKIYAQEFARAVSFLTEVDLAVTLWNPTDYDTPFERKYALSGHSLWRVSGTIRPS